MGLNGAMPGTVIYTAIFGGYDELRDPPPAPAGVEYVCFTDDRSLRSEHWQVKVRRPRYPDPRLAAKWFKMNPHRALPGYRRSIWVDGGIQLSGSGFAGEVLRYLPASGLALFPHPARTSVAQEVQELVRLGRFAGQPFREQLAHYRAMGFPDDSGLYAGTIVVRDHASREIRRLGRLWMAENLRWTFRDQLSLPYVLWKLGITPGVVPYDLWDNPLFTMVAHNRQS